jgi:hypothetical protein
MGRAKRFSWAAALAGVALLVGSTSVVTSQEKKAAGPPAGLDRAKNDVIERPTKVVVNQTSAPTSQPARRPLDISKTLRIEPPVRAIVTATSAPARTRAEAGDKFINPKVEPGKVRWHPTLSAACAAASKSKKPVLLFQMMGKLDDQFC